MQITISNRLCFWNWGSFPHHKVTGSPLPTVTPWQQVYFECCQIENEKISLHKSWARFKLNVFYNLSSIYTYLNIFQTLKSEAIIYRINIWVVLRESLQNLQGSPGLCGAQVRSHRVTRVNYAVYSPGEDQEIYCTVVKPLVHYITPCPISSGKLSALFMKSYCFFLLGR